MSRNGLSFGLQNLKRVERSMQNSHFRLLEKVDTLEIESVPEYPSKFLISISSFEEIGKSVSELTELDIHLKEATDLVFGDLLSFDRIARMARNLKLHLSHLKDRVERDSKYIYSSMAKISTIIGEFRSRCKQEFTEFLKSVDFDLRKTLKPLVPSSVIEENVKFPLISTHLTPGSSQNSSRNGDTAEELDSTTDKLNNHINMLVNTLENVAKDLIQILAETNRKYYEFVYPHGIDSSPPTPLAAPLPEYFAFELDQSQHSEPLVQPNKEQIQKIIGKINKLVKVGDLTAKQSVKIKDKLAQLIDNKQAFDIDSILNDVGMNHESKEQIIFKLIHTGLIEEKLDSYEITQKQPKAIKAPVKHTERINIQKDELNGTFIEKFDFETKKKPSFTPKKLKEERRAPNRARSIQRKRSSFRVRSTTPGLSDLHKSKTPVARKPKKPIK